VGLRTIGIDFFRETWEGLGVLCIGLGIFV